jgi:hypothetical protein
MADERSEQRPHAIPATEARFSDPALRPERPPRRFRSWRLAACVPWLFLGFVPHVVIVLVLVPIAVHQGPVASDWLIEARIQPEPNAFTYLKTESEREEEFDEPIEEPDIEELLDEDESANEDDAIPYDPYEGHQTNMAIGLGGGAGGAFVGRRGGRRGLRRRYGSGGPVTRPPAEFSTSRQGPDPRGGHSPGSATPLRPTGQWQRSEHRPSFARVYVGSGNSLQLKRMRVTVQLDGPRARTVVDHIFYNPHPRQLVQRIPGSVQRQPEDPPAHPGDRHRASPLQRDVL